MSLAWVTRPSVSSVSRSSPQETVSASACGVITNGTVLVCLHPCYRHAAEASGSSVPA